MLPLHSSEYSEEKEASENLLSDSCENGSLEERESNRSGGARVYWAIGLLATSNVITILLLIILRQGTSLKPGTASVFPNGKPSIHISLGTDPNKNSAEYESVMFQKDERFVKPPSIESNAAWQAAIPGFVGLMYINDSQHFGLPEGRYASDGTPNVYGVSWTHQYHCLVSQRSCLSGNGLTCTLVEHDAPGILEDGAKLKQPDRY